MVPLVSYVDGEYVGDHLGGPGTHDRENPADVAEVVSTARWADPAIAEHAVASARAASSSWQATPAPVRGDVLRRCADLLEQRTAAIAQDMAREQGKTVPEAAGEVGRSVAILRYFAAQTLAPDGSSYPSHQAGTRLFSRRIPVGVVSAITPWNFPLAIPVWKIAPALAYGNTVVWKPSEVVPLTSTALLAAFIDAGLPGGVLHMLLGGGAGLGPALYDVDAVTFTGSTSVGREVVLPAAVASGAQVQLELGGKNVAVVLADADLDLAVAQVARGAFLSAGQKCTATSLVLAQESIRAELAARLSAWAAAAVVGDPRASATEIGPLATAAQLERYESFLDPAAHGGTVIAGGRGPAGGHFARPAVICDADPHSRASRDEIFAPIAVLEPVADLSDALRRANETHFGLTASIFTSELAAAYRFIDEIETGIVKVNQESAGLEFHVPFGGIKDSGYGPAEQGLAAQEFYTRSKTVYLTHAG
ncbi:aldehyde dehydrogenase family protein [Nocardioides daeguensis]|uniref:Aldehyde dehydrogenase family protein n=2 Tax=Nocardioides daeguensis TaxID=908359 RepID=A0ABP6W7Z5_9ACTN|nr:aldehyde dehydrogenase family protein [Nocardioides daeguensis]MCR1775373.1 aldehyde dehydrogenase family protein [Nocardioides daeguensis]